MLAIVTEESKHAPNFLLTTINPLDNGHTPNETISSFLANYRGMHEMCAVPLRFCPQLRLVTANSLHNPISYRAVNVVIAFLRRFVSVLRR